MKKFVIIAVLFGALVAGNAAYAESGWATAGKVLTGVVAADILLNHTGYCHGYSSYGFSYGHYGRHHGYSIRYHSAPRVYYSSGPSYRCAPRYYRAYRCYPRSRCW